MAQKGFTLIELVIILVLLGIVAVFVAPRLGNVPSMNAAALSDKLRADIRYAQNLAMTRNQRGRVTFRNAPNGYDVTLGGNPVIDPAGSGNLSVTLNTGNYVGISIAIPTGFSGNYVEFDSMGVPYDSGGALAAAKSVTVANGQTVTVTPQTGAVN